MTEARGLPHTLHRRVTLSPLSHVTSASGTRNSGGTGDDGRVKGHTPLIASANGSNTKGTDAGDVKGGKIQQLLL